MGVPARLVVRERRRARIVKGRRYEWRERAVYLPADFPDVGEVVVLTLEEHERLARGAGPTRVGLELAAIREELLSKAERAGVSVHPVYGICPLCGRARLLAVVLHLGEWLEEWRCWREAMVCLDCARGLPHRLRKGVELLLEAMETGNAHIR